MRKGTIRCNKCKARVVLPDSCPSCSHTRFYVDIYWKGRHYYRRDTPHGETLSYKEAAQILVDINKAIEDPLKKFNPVDFLDKTVKDRKFAMQFEEYCFAQERRRALDKISPEHYGHILTYKNKYFSYFNDYDILDIQLEVIDTFEKQLPETMKSKTRKNILGVLRHFLQWLFRRGRIPQVPAFPPIESGDEAVRHALTREAQEQALENIPTQYQDPIIFMMMTGVRPGECVSILIKSCDAISRCVWIERSRSGNVQREKTKNKSKLPVPLNDTALEIVRENIKGKMPGDHLFINPGTGKAYTQWFLWNTWVKYSQADVTLYEATRHSFCSQISRKINPQLAQRLMRHKDRRSTDRYFHEWADDMLDAVQGIDNVVPFKRTDDKISGG